MMILTPICPRLRKLVSGIFKRLSLSQRMLAGNSTWNFSGIFQGGYMFVVSGV